MNNSTDYLEKKKKFESMLTLYGRNVVLEALQEESVHAATLHLSLSNAPAKILEQIQALATRKNVLVKMHEKKALSRISKNAKQDQGVALDIEMPSYLSVEDFLSLQKTDAKLIALDGINNPQNLGMILRSCAAGSIHGVILPKKGSAKISPLVIKASAGALFKTTIIYCDTLFDALLKFKNENFELCRLSSHTHQSLFETNLSKKTIFVLGNESEGVSKEVEKLCDTSVAIPMNNGVESLNVAVTAALIAFYQL